MLPRRHRLVVALAAACLGAIGQVQAASFVYSGQLDYRGQPANGRYDLRLTPFGHETLGNSLAAPMEFSSVEVRDGNFKLEFELPLTTSDATFIEVGVRDAGTTEFATLPGRSKALAAAKIGQCWSSSGDTGTDPALNFLGTTDARPLVLRTQNVQTLRLEPSGLQFGSPALPITANVIAGSRANLVPSGVRGATIAGGGVPSGDSDPDFLFEGPNRVVDAYGSVGGGYANTAGSVSTSTIDAAFATVAGGVSNAAIGFGSAIGGGQGNLVIGQVSGVGGGVSNVASGHGAAIGGGNGNNAAGNDSAIAGGISNTARAAQSTIGGGIGNIAAGVEATVAGGDSNAAVGETSTVGGGFDNCAGGQNSFAAGRGAKVRPQSDPGAVAPACSALSSFASVAGGDFGTFVWADSQVADFVSSGPNQFLIRAQNGAAINTNTPQNGAALTLGSSSNTTGALAFGSQIRQMVNLWGANPNGLGSEYGIGVQLNTTYFRSGRAFAWYDSGEHNDGFLEPGNGGDRLMTLAPAPGGLESVSGVLRAQSFVSVSDRAMKTAFAAIDPLDVLGRVVALPVNSWAYRNAREERHIGPVAQDFHAAFGLGSDDRTINSLDASGVALAAIQGLNTKLEAENDTLRARLADIERRLAAIVDGGER
jgi:hypothetical protein